MADIDFTRPLPIKDAPRDGTMLRLLVDYGDVWDGDHPLEDSGDPSWTFGFNNLANTGEDEWQFVGWSWQQDIFCDGRGKPIAFAYLPEMLEFVQAPSDSAWQPDDGPQENGGE